LGRIERLFYDISDAEEKNMRTNVMDASVHHIAISVDNLEKEIEFYRDILGFEVEWDMDNRGSDALCKVVGLRDVNPHIVMLSGYRCRLELFEYNASNAVNR
jgi:hypothetical protein